MASHQPSRLASFYAELLGVQASEGLNQWHWLIPLAEGISMEIYRPSRSRPFPERGRCLAPCLRLQASGEPLLLLQSMIPDLLNRGASVLEPPRQERFGAETWIHDPEGNAVLLVVPFTD
ncbi:MAG: glyoxalase/bleomycin resistance/dioxygenase family protein [Cyanobium sp. NAT70]|nr:glyoxalase/bleomycin resistance/dioxygenase family protein [Cyanobium sp. NAT70]